MRRRSATNSRPAEDEEYRAWYRQQAPFDELLKYFPWCGFGKVRVPGSVREYAMHDTTASDIHHAFGGREGRWDRVWNLVAVCRPVHEFCERYKADGRVLAIRLKIDQGLWDEADARERLGFSPLGKLECWACEHSFVEKIRFEMVRRLKQGELP